MVSQKVVYLLGVISGFTSNPFNSNILKIPGQARNDIF